MPFNCDEQAYLSLLRRFSISSSHLSSDELRKLAFHVEPHHPFDVFPLARLSSTDRHVFGQAFEKLLTSKLIRWDILREPIIDLAFEVYAHEQRREVIRGDAEPLPSLSSIAIGFSGHFRRQLSKFFFAPSLECARRGPALFAARLLKSNAPLVAISADEWLAMPPSIFKATEDIAIFYLCTHGRIQNSEYQAALHERYWRPSPSDFGSKGPKVLVLDTCHGADSRPPYQTFWGQALHGTSIRLLLACEGPIVVDIPSTERGYAFADNIVMANTSIADAWLNAVHSTSSTGTSRPVAIGLGGTAAEAKAMLSLTFHDLCSIATRPPSLSAVDPVQFATLR